RILEEADVIGITTTGLAKNIAMLRGIGAKVVICEEAAEVMEPHLISAMMPGIEHLIQIGDHRQLRPQINNYGFSVETSRGKKFQLDRSQFERRAEGEPGLAPLPVAQLNVQRRMRPEISSLIRTVYPDLKGHDCVQNFPGVTGMREHLFWLNHQHPEDGRYDGAKVKSHSNSWEVSMSTALVRHLVRQGEYKSTDIALLTPYTGQLQKLMAALSGDFEVFLSDRDLEKLADDGFGHADGVESDSVDSVDDAPRIEHNRGRMLQKTALVNAIQLATVDNFQGEEAKVIIVSLVRSNSNNEIGFLRTENRVNVLLSRAQHGMYLIGNARTYRGVNIWDDVYQQLAERGAVGDSIALCCRHPDIPIVCSNPDEFLRRSPEGGCTLRCDQRLDPCGHRCPAMCHSQALHDVFSCSQPCPRIRTTCQHACPKLCGEDCGPCRVTVTDVELPCGHIADEVECCQTPHPETIRCLHPVTKIVPDCKHKVKVPCETDVSQYYHCPTPCEATLACGDRCTGQCGTCQHSHKECQRICRLPPSTCNHLCARKCHSGELCGSCCQPCQPCHKPCAPCIEKCGWACEHMGQCSLPCAAPCDRLPCDKRCSRKLKCGHQCPSFCGEECPEDLCQLCCQDERRQRRVDVLEWKLYREVDLDDSSIVVLSCGHFFTGETLDGSLGMTQVYTTNSNGEYNGLRDIAGTLSTSGVPSCPDCRIPIRQFATRRYNRVVNKAVMDETIKRFFVDGRRRLQELQQRLAAATAKLSLDNIPEWDDTVPRSGTSSVLRDRHRELNRINLTLGIAKQQMDTEHQPAKKLFDAIVSSRRRQLKTLSMEQRLPELSLTGPPPAYNSQVLLEAEALHLQVRAAILQDKMRIAAKVPELQEGLKNADRPGADVPGLMKDCMEGIKKSREWKLPRLVISLSQLYAQTSQLAGRYSAQYRARTVEWRDYGATAGELLIEALQLCGTFEDGESFREDVQEALKALKSTRYEKVSREEVKAIKLAMVSGFGGMSTNSGHWYNCQNGHPFAIGECGMPMEVARCPECGARIGGLDHELVDGVSRAQGME
ncbi:uncharacterized protein PODANS_5_1320, partial [Podospora anserina S mat+]